MIIVSRVRSTIAGIAAAAFLVGSSMAAAESPASRLSLANASTPRAAAKTEKVSKQSGGFPFLIVFVVIAAGLGLYFAVDGGGDDSN